MRKTRLFLALGLALLVPAVGGCGGGIEGQSLRADPMGAPAPLAVEEGVRERALGNGWSSMERSLAGGRWMVFHTTEALVPTDLNNAYDVYLKDLESGALTLISQGGDRASYYASISHDGNRIAFASDATNLVPGDTNLRRDIFLHDRVANTTQRLSVSSAGLQDTGTSTYPVISADGNLVAFVSNGRLGTGKTTTAVDVFLRDVAQGTTTLLTPALSGVGSNGSASTLSMSADGRFVAFVSAATNLVVGDTNGAADVFLLDRDTGMVERVSVTPGGVQANGACANPSVSDDGRYVAFESLASSLVTGDLNARRDVFLRDRSGAALTRVSVSSTGVEGNGDSTEPTLSRDGASLAFTSLASNLVDADTNGVADVFYRPSVTASEVLLASRTSAGNPGNGATDLASWDSGGGRLAFRTAASDLAEGAWSGRPLMALATLANNYFFAQNKTHNAPVQNDGLIGWLGTEGGKKPFVSPYTRGDISVAASSTNGVNHPTHTVGRMGNLFWEATTTTGWITWDLKRQFVLKGARIGYRPGTAGDRLEVSSDGVSWTTVYTRPAAEADGTLPPGQGASQAFSRSYFDVSGNTTSARYIRFQHPTADTRFPSGRFGVWDVEFYGYLPNNAVALVKGAFADSMDGGTADWTPSGSWGQLADANRGKVWTDTPAGSYWNNMDASVRSRAISLAGLKNCTLRFESKYSTESGYDYFSAEISPNGSTWTQLFRVSGSNMNWQYHTYNLPAAAYDNKQVYVRFRMTTDGSVLGDGCYVDNVGISGEPIP